MTTSPDRKWGHWTFNRPLAGDKGLVPPRAATAVASINPTDAEAYRAKLRRLLTENLLPFWCPRILDGERGGYRVSFDSAGHPRETATKTIISQARTCWFFSRISGSPFGTAEHLYLAEHGFRFLSERLWDAEHGGFFWAIDPNTRQPVIDIKHLYGQAFGLYALCQYCAATADLSAREMANALFDLIERAHDPQHGGYREFFRRDWSDISPATVGPMGVGPKVKLMNTHLHLMESISDLVRLGGRHDTVARQRLAELVLVQSNAVVRKQLGACSDRHAMDWTPMLEDGGERVSYGHDLENVWLLMEACDALGMPSGPLIDLFRWAADYAIRYGYDEAQGGFFESGPFNRKADQRSKIWWTQAEALVGLLRLFKMTGDERYRQCFAQTLDWVSTRQADWEVGEWHPEVRPSGRGEGDKAGPWKTPYHTGRSMLRCLELLQSL